MRPSEGRADACASKSAGSGSVVRGRRAVTVDQTNDAHALAAATRTGSRGRVPHRVERRPMSRPAAPPTAETVTTPLVGWLSTHGASSSAATAKSISATPEIAPRHAVASPSRTVGCSTPSSKIGVALGRVHTDQAVMRGEGCGDHQEVRPSPDQRAGDQRTALTAARAYAKVGRHGFGSGVTRSPAGP